MSIATLAGAVAGQGWRIAAYVLAGLLLATAGAGGAAWWLTDRAMRQAQADLAAARDRADDLGAAIREQNRATEVLRVATAAAQARGTAARAQAAIDARRYDAAQQRLAGARPASCAEAMPYVNQLLQDLK